MTIIIYYTEDKKNYHIIRPQMEGENKFRGNVKDLVEQVTKSNLSDNVKKYHSFEIIN